MKKATNQSKQKYLSGQTTFISMRKDLTNFLKQFSQRQFSQDMITEITNLKHYIYMKIRNSKDNEEEREMLRAFLQL